MSFTSLVMISATGRDTSQQKNLHFVIFRAETDQSWSQNWTLTLLRDLQSLIRLPPCVCLIKCIQSRDIMFSDFWIISSLNLHQKYTDKEVYDRNETCRQKLTACQDWDLNPHLCPFAQEGVHPWVWHFSQLSRSLELLTVAVFSELAQSAVQLAVLTESSGPGALGRCRWPEVGYNCFCTVQKSHQCFHCLLCCLFFLLLNLCDVTGQPDESPVAAETVHIITYCLQVGHTLQRQ